MHGAACRSLRAPRPPGARARAAFGTYVVFGTDVRCRIPATGLEWNPKKEVMILVLLTWGLEALTLCAPARAIARARLRPTRRPASGVFLHDRTNTRSVVHVRHLRGYQQGLLRAQEGAARGGDMCTQGSTGLRACRQGVGAT